MTTLRFAATGSLLALSLTSVATAQTLMVCRHEPARIELYSATDGSLLDANFIDIDGLTSAGGGIHFAWDVTVAPNGEIWVSNYSASAVQRYSSDGSTYLGDLPTTAGASTGMTLDGVTLGITTTSGGGGVFSYDTATMTETQLPPTGTSWDVTSRGTDWLVTYSNGDVTSLDPVTGVETPWANAGGLSEQIAITASGEVYVANYTGNGYTIFDSNGALLQTHNSLGSGNVRGVAPLGNGEVLLCGSSGVYRHDPATGGLVTLDTGSGAYITSSDGSTGGIGDNYCMANPNSTGSEGSISASGSVLVATNDVTLTASDLPSFSFGFFITSQTQGFIPNPAGSAGNLCLSGAIGRYVGPGEIQQTGNGGSFSLTIDLTAVPQPNGFVAVQGGQTWNFQAWHRDTNGGAPTSNFTDGLAISFL